MAICLDRCFQQSFFQKPLDHLAVHRFHRHAKPAFKLCRPDAAGQPQPQKHKFFHPLLTAQFVYFLILRARCQFFFRKHQITVQIRRHLKAFPAHQRGCPQTKPQILHTGPVTDVVAAGIARSGIIGNLIPLIAQLRQRCFRMVVHIPVCLLIRQTFAAFILRL